MAGIPFKRKVLESVIYIKNSFGKIGTGVLVSYERKDSSHVLFIFTNKHVLQNDEGIYADYIIARFYLKESAATDVKIENVKIMLKERGELANRVFPHSERNIDVAGILISDLSNINDKIRYTNIGQDLLLTIDKAKEELIDVGEDVLILGYPAGVFSSENFLPIVKQGVISSSPYEDLKIQLGDELIKGKIILVDAALFGGSSGSPVFVKPRWKATKDEKTGNQIVNIGKAIPSYLIGIQSSAIEVSEKIYTRIVEGPEDLSQNVETTKENTLTARVEKDEEGEFFYLTKQTMINMIFSSEYILDIFKDCDKRFPPDGSKNNQVDGPTDEAANI